MSISPRLQSLKNRTRDLIRAFGGQEAAALEVGKSQTQMQRYGSINADDFAPVNVILALEASTQGEHGHPHVTAWMARELGFALVRLPCPEMSATIWGRRAAQLMQDAGDIITGIGKALEDNGEMDPKEAEGLLPDSDKLVNIAVEIAAALKRRADGQY